MIITLTVRSDTYEALAAEDYIAFKGEPIFEEDTGRLRIGDGEHRHADLRVLTYDAMLLQQLSQAAIDAAAAAAQSAQDAEAAAGGGAVATETVFGVVQLATPAEVVAGTDTAKAVTSAGVAARLSGVTAAPDATTTVKGLVALATNAEALTGTDAAKAITPAAMSAFYAGRTPTVPAASDTGPGVVELATSAETIAGTDAVRATTPVGVAAAIGAQPSATTAVRGLVPLATSAEGLAGADTTKAMTAAATKAAIQALAPIAAPSASDTVAGTVELATNTETFAGTDATRAVTPQGFMSALRDYEPTIGQLPAVETADPDTLPRRGADGSFDVPETTTAARPVPYSQLTAAIAGIVTPEASTSFADVIGPSLGSQPTSTVATFVEVPDLVYNRARSGRKYRCGGMLVFRGLAAAGVALRLKSYAGAVTNMLTNPTFADLTGWHWSNNCTVTLQTSGGYDGANCARVTVNAGVTAATITLFTDWFEADVDAVRSAGLYAKRISTTARNTRCDVQFGDTSATDTSQSTGIAKSVLGAQVSPGTAYTRVIRENAVNDTATTVSNGVKARLRFTILSAVAGDTFDIDAAQLEAGATLPVYGNTGGGSSVLVVTGDIRGPKVTPGALVTVNGVAASEDADRRTTIRFPAVSNLTHYSGGLGTTQDAEVLWDLEVAVGGNELTGQSIGLEWAQMAANATPTQLMAGWATFAEVP